MRTNEGLPIVEISTAEGHLEQVRTAGHTIDYLRDVKRMYAEQPGLKKFVGHMAPGLFPEEPARLSILVSQVYKLFIRQAEIDALRGDSQ